MTKKTEELRPFFANFLEGQENLEEKEQGKVLGGGPPTRKYPSDKDE